jgi:polar amino acid transport system permease protein
MLDFLPDGLKAILGDGVAFWLGYLTNGKHQSWYASVQYTLAAAILGALTALLFGLCGAALRTARFAPLRWLGAGYTNMVRGIPDVLFFLFFPLAFEQLLELLLAQGVCGDEWQTAQWPPCPAANLRFGTLEFLLLASLSLGIIYGAFVANVISGALKAVPAGQLEAARAFGLSNAQVFWRIQVRQMWVYALPGLSNCWLLLIKSTSLLSLLQIADLVYWADRLGTPNFSAAAGLVHGDWRWIYYLALLVFYILLTFVSEKVFKALTRWAGRGMAMGSAR